MVLPKLPVMMRELDRQLNEQRRQREWEEQLQSRQQADAKKLAKQVENAAEWQSLLSAKERSVQWHQQVKERREAERTAKEQRNVAKGEAKKVKPKVLSEEQKAKILASRKVINERNRKKRLKEKIRIGHAAKQIILDNQLIAEKAAKQLAKQKANQAEWLIYEAKIESDKLWNQQVQERKEAKLAAMLLRKLAKFNKTQSNSETFSSIESKINLQSYPNTDKWVNAIYAEISESGLIGNQNVKLLMLLKTKIKA